MIVLYILGGAVISNAAEYVNDRIKTLVYVCALVPRNGDKIIDILNRDAGSAPVNSVNVNRDQMSIELNLDKIEEVMYNGCEKDDVAYAKGKIIPQPLNPLQETIIMAQKLYRTVERIGVLCTEDRSLSPALQEKMYKDAGCSIRFLQSGHAPYFSKAEELGNILLGC